MCTWDIENRQHRSLLEHWQWQIADIDFVKYRKHRATTLKLDPRQLPCTTTIPRTIRGGWRCGWSPGGRRCEGHRDGQVSDVTVVSDTELKLVLFACGGRHNGTRSGSFRWQMTIVEIIVAKSALNETIAAVSISTVSRLSRQFCRLWSGKWKWRKIRRCRLAAFTCAQMTWHLDDHHCSAE